MLMKDEKFSQELRRTVADVDTLVKEVQSDALKLKVVKINWFGTDKKKGQ
jgi:hypothetical protein